MELRIDNPLGFLTLLLDGDADGDGVYEPITSTFIQGMIPESASCAGDSDGDGDVDLGDLSAFELCLSGPGAVVPADCLCPDLDGDSDVDLVDFRAFQIAFTGAGAAP